MKFIVFISLLCFQFSLSQSIVDSLELSDESSVKENFMDNFSFNNEVLLHYNHNDFRNESFSANPDNKVAELNQNEIGLFLRPEVNFNYGKFNLNVQPRLNIVLSQNNGKTQDDYDFYFYNLKLEFNVTEYLNINLGRYVYNFGNSPFYNPSNPYVNTSLTLNPKIEIQPRDFVEVNFMNKNSQISVIANVTEGTDPTFDSEFFPFERGYSVHYNLFGDTYNLDAMAFLNENMRNQYALNFKKTLNNSTIVWMESTLENKPLIFAPRIGHSTELLDYEMFYDESEKYKFSSSIGLSHALKIGPTIQLEYLYNGKGYSDEQVELINEMMKDASNYNFDITADLSRLNLGRTINAGLPYVRKNYIFSSIGENDKWGKLNYNVRYFYCLDDDSSQISSLIEFSLNDNLHIYNVLLYNFGDDDADFRRIINFSNMAGLSYRF